MCKEAIVSIEGMICQSCVKNIEATVSSHDGVYRIEVSLDNKQGRLLSFFPTNYQIVLAYSFI